MNIIQDIKGLCLIRKKISTELTIGFVPTMGFLHQGHGALIESARNENDIVFLSIFVNPTQFNDANDFEKYPRKLEADLSLAKELNVDYVFMPDKQDIYPNENLVFIDTNHPIANIFEGKYRPGHFKGVLTVVMKLLQLVNPMNAYFGEKDFQQAALITALVQEFFMPVNIVVCDIVRLASGLPFSSRNSRLSQHELALATRVYSLLKQITFDNIQQIHGAIKQMGVMIDYLEPYQDRIFMAIRIGDVRLIDNFIPGKL